MQNLHLLHIKYLGATNTLGARIKITSYRFQQSIIINYDYSCSTAYEIAKNHLEKLGFNIIALAELKEGYALLSDTFEPLKEVK